MHSTLVTSASGSPPEPKRHQISTGARLIGLPTFYGTLARIRVLASVIEHGGRFLVGKRPIHKRHGGLWEFPGGKVESDESDFQAVARELEEELGVRVSEVGSVMYSVADAGSQFVVEFLAVTIEGEPLCIEHTELAWVTEEELLVLPLAPSDLQFCRSRRNSIGGASAGHS